jgi:uncharacterized membrane protein YoaK (UPF0700 family)
MPTALLLSGLFAVAIGPLSSPVSAAPLTGSVVGWGNNSSGQTDVPPGLSGVTAIAACGSQSLALRADGTVVAWGAGEDVPAGLSDVTAISCGWGHILALKSDGTVVAWGSDSYGQTEVPAGLSGVTAIAAGGVHSLALKSDGTVVSWGIDRPGILDTPPAGLSGVTAIAAGGEFSLALKSDGTVAGWGYIYFGTPNPPADLSGVIAISAGFRQGLALKSDGTVVGWGGEGQPFVPAGLSGITAISAGESHDLALKSDGTVVAWGDDYYGQADVPIGLSGVIAISAGAHHSLALVPSSLLPAAAATYHTVTASRILDTRDGYWIGLAGAFSSHVARTFWVIGRGGVPANATAVTGNLTVTGQTAAGFLYIGPNAANNPTTSTLNFPIGDDRANAVTVALAGAGTLSVTYAAPTLDATAQVVFDVTGYFTPDTSGATYHALTPARVLDCRDGYWIGLAGAFSSHAARTFQVAGYGGVPANATAVTGNLTVTGQTVAGFLYVGPNAANNPTTSTLNFPLGDDRANAVTVALGAGGTLSVTYAAPTLGATAQVIFDVTGYFTPDVSGATYVPLTPTRVLDSRDGYWIGLSGAFSSHAARTFAVSGHAGVPGKATAVTGNLTVTGQTAAGFLYVGPNAVNDPTSSTLNFPVGDDRANAVTVALGAGGTLSATYAAPSLGQSAQVIFDVSGYFTP